MLWHPLVKRGIKINNNKKVMYNIITQQMLKIKVPIKD